MWGSQLIGGCGTRGGISGNTYYIFLYNANKAEPTQPKINRNPKQGHQWPQNRTCVCVQQKIKKKNNLAPWKEGQIIGHVSMSAKEKICFDWKRQNIQCGIELYSSRCWLWHQIHELTWFPPCDWRGRVSNIHVSVRLWLHCIYIVSTYNTCMSIEVNSHIKSEPKIGHYFPD